MSSPLPAGTVTFLFTDIEASTRLWEEHGERMGVAVRAHYAILAEAIGRHGGVRPVEQGEGDSVLAAFSRASDGLAAALQAQRRLLAGGGPGGLPVRVRMALHSAEAQLRDEGNYYGASLSRGARIRALAAGGQTLLSRTTRDLVIDRLPDGASLVDVGIHRLRDLDRREHVFALAHPDLPPPPVTLRSLDALRHNLPTQLSSFVGRQRELAEIQTALSRTRLLTLTGTGGCGKTRLAAHAAADALTAFPDGVWWVELASVADDGLVDRAVADAVGVRPLPGQTALEALVARLTDACALVVLDNCEHVLDDAAKCAEALLRGCPRVSVLATSRVALASGAETRWRVPSLTLPAGRGVSEPVESLSDSDAVRLFIERARQVHPGFSLTAKNASAVAQVCRDVDGMPLAIELAAARVRLLPIEAIAAGLDDRFRLLTGGSRGAFPRQQTLRASVDWSHDLLDVNERALLRRLAIFRGGWTLDAAEAVCARDPLDRGEVLDTLSSLVDKSLVEVDHDVPGGRYRLLETVRQYGLEQLRQAEEEELIADRHRDAMVQLADRAALELATPRGREWLDALDIEAANLTAALERAAATDPEVALGMCAALFLWWKARGAFRAADDACALALNAGRHAPSALRAGVLGMRASLAAFAGNLQTAWPCAEQALAMAEEIDDTLGMARALDVLATIHLFPDPTRAQELGRQSHALATAAGDDWCRCSSGLTLALSHLFSGERDECIRVLDAIWPLLERVGSAEFTTWYWLGQAVAAETRDLARWRDCAMRALASAEDVGEPTSGDFATVVLASAMVREGRAAETIELLTRRREQVVAAHAHASLITIDLALAQAYLATDELAQAEAALTAIVTAGADGGTQLATAHGHLAEIALIRNDAPRAARHADELTTISFRLANPGFRSWAAYLSGRAAAGLARRNDARALLRLAIGLQLEHGLDLMLPDSLEALAEVDEHGDAFASARLLAVAARARDELGIVRVPTDGARWSALNERLHQALGDARYTAATAAEEALALHDAAAWVTHDRSSATTGQRA